MVELGNKLSFLKIVSFDSLTQKTYDKKPLVNLDKVLSKLQLEVCMGMGKTGIPWDSHGNGN